MLRMDQIMYLTDYRTLGPAVLIVPLEGIPNSSWHRCGMPDAPTKPARKCASLP